MLASLYSNISFVEAAPAEQAAGVLRLFEHTAHAAQDARALAGAPDHQVGQPGPVVHVRASALSTTFLKGTQFEFGKYFTTRTFVGLQVQITRGFRVEHQLSRNPGLSIESTLSRASSSRSRHCESAAR